MKTNVKEFRNSDWVPILILFVTSVILIQCNLDMKNDDEDEMEDLDPIEQAEKLLTAHDWKLIQDEIYSPPGEVLPEGLRTVTVYDDVCQADDYWEFDADYDYEENYGSITCDSDEDRINDYGEWGMSAGLGEDIELYIGSDKGPYYLDNTYLVYKLTSTSMILKSGNCAKPGGTADSACFTRTFQAK